MKKGLIGSGSAIALLTLLLLGCVTEQQALLKHSDVKTGAMLYGRPDEALKYYEEALRNSRKLNNYPPQYISILLDGLAQTYQALGRYNEALNYYDEALQIQRELNSPSGLILSLTAIARLYTILGCYDEAMKYNEEALKMRNKGRVPGFGAFPFIGMGKVYLELKNYEKAANMFRDAEKYLAGIGYKPDHITEWCGDHMVELYLAMEKYEEALKLIEELRLISEKKWLEIAKALGDRAPVYTQRGWSSVPASRIYYCTRKGLALKGLGRLRDASEYLLEAVLLIEDVRQRIKGERTGFFSGSGARSRAYRGLVVTLSERAMRGEKEDEKFSIYGQNLRSAAFYFSESIKARGLLESMAKHEQAKHPVEIPKELWHREQTLIYQLWNLDSQWSQAYKQGEAALLEFEKKEKELTSELNSLIDGLRHRYPRYAALYHPKPIPPEDLPLRDDEVLLEYALGDDAAYVFIVRRGGVRRLHRIAIGKDALETKVKAFMEPLITKRYENFSVKKAKELYNVLLAEAFESIQKDEKVIIIPDGILGLLPFEALVIEEGAGVGDSVYVGERYSLGYYQSATVLALQRLLKGRVADRVLFALGNPVYSDRDERYTAYRRGEKPPVLLVQNIEQYAYRALATRRQWGKTTKNDKEGKELVYTPLPETESEIRAIASFFGIKPLPPDILLGIWANETNLRRSPLRNYRYLHFATHADLSGKVQGINEPFLLLGQVENEGNDDGFLTMSEVLELDLDADLVVLSACLTGRGKVMEGEGVLNFARAFQHAGARSVVVSLWEVASKEAVEYMKAFYGYLKAGKGKAEALRLASRDIKAKYPNPFYWAVFILHGEG